LTYFDLIVPCGIQSVAMTSIARELPAGSAAAEDVTAAVSAAFARTFGLAAREVSLENSIQEPK
jgi:lipoate-protein ligase B